MTKSLRTTALWVTALTFAVGFDASAQNWTRVTEIPVEGVYAIAADGAMMYAATDSAIYVSRNAGESWQPAARQPAGAYFQTLLTVRGTVYAGTNGNGIYQSKDSGASWTDISAGLSSGGRHIVALARLGDTLFAGTGGDGVSARRLTDGSPWVSYNDGLNQLGTNALLATDDLLAGCIGMYVFVRQRGGTQWELATNDSIQGPAPLSLARDGTSLYLGTSSGVYRGSLDGKFWQKADIPQFSNQDIVALASVGSRLFAGLNYRFDHWLFSTENQGVTWDVRAHEFASLTALLPVDTRMWAGRSDGLWWYDMGVWTSVGSSERAIPARMVLHPNYPNPFNPVTTIRFTVQDRTPVTISVHNPLGVQVATLLDSHMDPGTHEVRFDGTDLASGVYLVRLRAGEHVATQRCVLLR